MFVVWKSRYLPISDKPSVPTTIAPPLCQFPLTGVLKLIVPLLVIVPPSIGAVVAILVTLPFPLPVAPVVTLVTLP